MRKFFSKVLPSILITYFLTLSFVSPIFITHDVNAAQTRRTNTSNNNTNNGGDASSSTSDSTPTGTSTPTTTPAAGNNSDTPTPAQSNTTTSGSSNSFLGLVPWYQGVDTNIDSESGLKNGIWQIAANVAFDITVIAAYLVIGYVIYGGYLYIFSGGDPGKVANGKKTLSQAFIGLAITMSASAIMSTIRLALLGASGKFVDCTESNCVDPKLLIDGTIGWFIGVAGVISAIFLVYGGISYITSSGDPNKTQKAKQMITYSLIGLVIVALATAITAFVSNMIRGAQ